MGDAGFDGTKGEASRLITELRNSPEMQDRRDYRDDLESGTLIHDVEDWMGMTQEQSDRAPLAAWQEQMGDRAIELGEPEPPFAEDVKRRRRNDMANALNSAPQVPAPSVGQIAGGVVEIVGNLVKLVLMGIVLTEILVLEGFVPSAIHDGAEAVEHCRAQHYDAIVLDVMLPGRSLMATSRFRAVCRAL